MHRYRYNSIEDHVWCEFHFFARAFLCVYCLPMRECTPTAKWIDAWSRGRCVPYAVASVLQLRVCTKRKTKKICLILRLFRLTRCDFDKMLLFCCCKQCTIFRYFRLRSIHIHRTHIGSSIFVYEFYRFVVSIYWVEIFGTHRTHLTRFITHRIIQIAVRVKVQTNTRFYRMPPSPLLPTNNKIYDVKCFNLLSIAPHLFLSRLSIAPCLPHSISLRE